MRGTSAMADTGVQAASRQAPPEDDWLPAIELVGVEKRFSSAHGDVRAVEHVDLRIAEGEFFSLLGPSGCGKTTTLRMIAGFEEPTSGRILLHGRDMVGVAPYRRDVNMVFQQYALFPHMDVFDNVAFGPRRGRGRRLPAERRRGPWQRGRPGSAGVAVVAARARLRAQAEAGEHVRRGPACP